MDVKKDVAGRGNGAWRCTHGPVAGALLDPQAFAFGCEQMSMFSPAPDEREAKQEAMAWIERQM